MDNKKLWVGIDAGKEAHWAHVLDASGKEILSRKVENDEADLAGLIEEVLALCEEAVWAVDQPGGGAALLLALLWERDQRVLYLPGLAVERTCDALSRRVQDGCPRCSPDRRAGQDEA